jgi:hypothetical protein
VHDTKDAFSQKSSSQQDVLFASIKKMLAILAPPIAALFEQNALKWAERGLLFIGENCNIITVVRL